MGNRSPRRLMGIVLLLVLSMVIPAGSFASAQPALVDGAPLQPAGGVADAVIRRTSFGIPHIVARDWTSLGFGHGYATAEDSACILADTMLTARGQRSRYLGPDERYTDQVTLNASNRQVDTMVTAWRDRGVVEAMLEDPAGPSERARALMQGYVDGYNRHLEVIGGADGINDPACAGADWVGPATALDLWYATLLVNVLASTGQFAPVIADADPPTAEDPGEPVDPCATGVPLPFCDEGTFADQGSGASADASPDASALDAPSFDAPSFDAGALRAAFGRDPAPPFGSNATALGSDITDTGRGMLLGNPHFPWLGRNRFHQAQLTIPGVYDVAGGSLHASPVINIGWNADVAWTHTVSTAFRFTPYEYQLSDGDPMAYETPEGTEQVERQEVTIEVLGEDGQVTELTEDVYRTEEGFVIDAPELFMPWTTQSVWAIRDANAEHLAIIDAFLELGEADSTQSLLDVHARTAGIPWVNTIAADRDGNALYADHSVVPHVTDAMAAACVTEVGMLLQAVIGVPGLDGNRADGECAWGSDDDAARPGIFGPANLPDTTRPDWVINANDSYWLPNPDDRLEGFAGIIGCEICRRSLRTRIVYRSVMDRLDGSDGLGGAGSVSHEQLQAIEVENRVFAAELARADDDLQDVCDASGVRAEACGVLAAWDGRSDIDSVGAILFREFWLRVPPDPWTVPFDPADPVATPRDLDEADPAVIQAMADAVEALDEAGIALDAPLGSQQVAIDDGPLSAGIPIHGGLGALGNANALGLVAIEGGPRYGVGYGSSHIQAVAFTDGGVDAATILTYGNAADPTSPHATDQTALWSTERWVDWPFTTDEQLADPGYRAYQVSADAVADLTPLSAALDPGRTEDPTAEVGLRVERVAAGERIGTAVEVSRRTFAVADVAVLVRADDFADALTGAPLATAVGGPLLLTGPEALAASVTAELQRLGVATVMVLGGEQALSADVTDQLADAGYVVDRIAGGDRFQTAARVAERLPESDLAFLATGGEFADAVSAAGVAAALGAPVLLSAGDVLPPATAAALEGTEEVLVIGGSAAISDEVAAEVGSRVTTVTRVAGADRFATSRAVLDVGLARGLDPAAVWLASGGSFPDALSAGASAGVLGSAVVLVGEGAGAAQAVGDLDLLTVLVAGGTAAVPEEALAGLGG